MSSTTTDSLLYRVLQEKFHQSNFRSCQLEIIKTVLTSQDVLVVLPTGHGKSLTFQLPAVVQSENGEAGFYIVVSPLLALMKDQVRQLQSLNISAFSVNSSTPARERKEILDKFAKGQGSLIYVSPEQCFAAGFRQFLENIAPHAVKRIIVDEAHCAVEWGSDFRKDYARLGPEFRRMLKTTVPIMALTGTASPSMQESIVKTLGLKDARVFNGSTGRPYLHYEVRYVEDPGERLVDMLRFLKMYRGRIAKLATTNRTTTKYPGCGIIYCRSRASTELIAAECNNELGQCAAAFHAGQPMSERNDTLNRWIAGDPECSVVVATIAFGLGIDKPDTRFVIHFDLPQNIEAFVQQTGRAGRDRKAARCILYYSAEDSARSMKFVADDWKSREATVSLLKFATTITQCRHKLIANYFQDNDRTFKCDYACDYCKMPRRLRQRYEEWYSQVS